MEPISLAIAGIGLGLQLFGASKSADNSAQMAKVSRDEAGHEQNINDLKQQQMELEGRRSQLENVRNNQRARAMATNAAVNQGAQFGSGLQGGLAQIQDESLFNMSGVNSALQTGRSINTQNQSISQDKMQMASLQGEQAQNQALSSLGGSILKAGPIIGQIGQGFGGGMTKAMNLFSPGSLSGGYGNT